LHKNFGGIWAKNFNSALQQNCFSKNLKIRIFSISKHFYKKEVLQKNAFIAAKKVLTER